MEQRLAEEVEDHQTRIFGIISDFRNNLGCAFEQNVPEAGSLTVCYKRCFVFLKDFCLIFYQGHS